MGERDSAEMRISISQDDLSVALVGARKIMLEDAHIGAVIDDESGAFVVGPLVLDRMLDFPMGDAGYFMGRGRGPIPQFDSLDDEVYEAMLSVVQSVADELGLELLRGRADWERILDE